MVPQEEHKKESCKIVASTVVQRPRLAAVGYWEFTGHLVCEALAGFRITVTEKRGSHTPLLKLQRRTSGGLG